MARAQAARRTEAVVTPVPGKELIKIVGLVLLDAGEHVGEPDLRIDVVETSALD